jgi:hypothetical protein
MAETVYRGPAMSIGPLMGTVIPQGASGFLSAFTTSGVQPAVLEPTDGPGIEYQANCFPDPRFGPFNKDSLLVGRIPVWLNSPYVVSCDGVPQATGAAAIAALQHTVSGTPMTLVTVAPGGTSAGTASTAICSLLPMLGATNQSFPPGGAPVSVLGLDMGFTTGTIAAGSGTVTAIADTTYLYPGQWISIGGAGSSTQNASLITQVQTIASATSITILPASLGTLTNAPISSANRYQPSPQGFFPFGGAFSGGATGGTGTSANAVQPYSFGGVGAIFNPLEGLTRGVTTTNSGAAGGGTFTVTGYDIYGQLMHENIVQPATATTTAGKKAFKYITSVVPNFTDATQNYSIGLNNIVGLNLRSDKWEYLDIFFNGGFATTNAGWTAALANGTVPTATTADVRGTITTTSLATIGAALNGTIRLTFMGTVPLYNLINSNPNNAITLMGQTQF